MVRALTLMIATVMLFGLACGRNKPPPKAVAGMPAEAFAPLTEDDVVRFARALPSVVAQMSWHGAAEGERLRARDDAVMVLAVASERVRTTEGIDSVFAANGVDWPFFRAMLYRLSACAYVVGLKEADEETRRMIRSEPTRAIASAMRRRLQQMKEIAAAVPPSNIEVFQRHFRELKGFFTIMGSD